jgi:hypothetical protein
VTTTKAVELVSTAPTMPIKDSASTAIDAGQLEGEFHALTDPRDPPDPVDVAYEQERRARLDAQAAETRQNIADAAARLGSAAFADYPNASAPTGADLPIIPLRDRLDGVEAFLRRFVVFGRPEAVVAVVLWVAHTYAMDAADATPYLAVTSPEKGSGKTRLLECVGLLARSRPQIFIIPTAATIYRMLEADPSAPLLLDELDAVFRDRSDKYEEVRALINAGHRRGATVPRTVTTGNKHEVRFFPVFGPKVLAGIGKLPDTVADRSIPIRMLKKKQTELVEKWRGRAAGREAERIALSLEGAIQDAPPALEAIVPNELPDRAADAWEPLLAIADAAGGEWPRRSRRAAIILHADRAEDDSLGLRLLSDTRLVFDRLAVDRLATVALIEALKADEESPWLDDHHPLTPERLARYLKAFEIRSKQMKIAGIKVRGFERESFVDSWDRYLSSPGTPPQNPVPRYPEHAAGTDVPGYNGGTGLQTEPTIATFLESDLVPSTDKITCANYLDHQFHHRFTTADGWTCDACRPGAQP